MTEAIAYEMNVETGETVERPRTVAELKAEAADQATRKSALTEIEAAEKKKAAILAALADATGFTVDELRDALNA